MLLCSIDPSAEAITLIPSDLPAAISACLDLILRYDSGGCSRNFHVQPIPVPAAVWLFASGLIGLTGMARRST